MSDHRAAATWQPGAPGVLSLPSGRLLRGRGLRRGVAGGELPHLGVYLLGKPPPHVPWESRWLRWPDFRLPSDREQARTLLREVWERAVDERVEVACGGGRGRTGTALACVAVLDGVPADEAVAYVRAHYDRHAVETPWQRRYVARFAA
ncbi:protein-tyrosine phosphatase family protein [Streptomyces sp. NPDC048518]|uniref:protein-tyrosine phosphatase family protein n=1 Tax=Streptomyces sp. NPDC048518 TaxID=3155029 RepID=UPI0033EA0303